MVERSETRVLLVDPSPFFYEGICNCLRRGGYLALEQAPNLEDALQKLTAQQSDLVLIGSNLQEHESLEISREITSRWSNIKTLVFTTHANDPLFQLDAVYAGTSACLPVETNDDECLEAIKAVVAGHQLFPREILAQGLQPIVLTTREREVLKLLAEGKTDKQIADALVLTFRTVHNHVHRILEKLDVHSRQEAVWRARHRGLV